MARREGVRARLASQLALYPFDSSGLRRANGGDFGRRRGNRLLVGRPDPPLAFKP